MLLAQDPDTKFIHTILLDSFGAQLGDRSTLDLGVPFNGTGRLGKVAAARSSDPFGALRALMITADVPVNGGTSFLTVGAMTCNHPKWDLSASELRCTNGSGSIQTPTFHGNSSWATSIPEFRHHLQAYEDEQDVLHFVLINFRNDLISVNTHTGAPSAPLMEDATDLNNFKVTSGMYAGQNRPMISYSRIDGSFGRIALNQEDFGDSVDYPSSWYADISRNILSGNGAVTHLADSDSDGISPGVDAHIFHTSLSLFGQLKAIHLQDHQTSNVGLIADIYSTNTGPPEITYQTISQVAVNRLPGGSTIAVYARRTTNETLPQLLMFSVCE